jgi:hypothetical protein
LPQKSDCRTKFRTKLKQNTAQILWYGNSARLYYIYIIQYVTGIFSAIHMSLSDINFLIYAALII